MYPRLAQDEEGGSLDSLIVGQSIRLRLSNGLTVSSVHQGQHPHVSLEAIWEDEIHIRVAPKVAFHLFSLAYLVLKDAERSVAGLGSNALNLGYRPG